MGKSLFLFNSSRHSIKGDSLCRKNGIKATVIATPEEISSECGMSLQVESSFVVKICDIFDAKNIEYKVILDYFIEKR